MDSIDAVSGSNAAVKFSFTEKKVRAGKKIVDQLLDAVQQAEKEKSARPLFETIQKFKKKDIRLIEENPLLSDVISRIDKINSPTVQREEMLEALAFLYNDVRSLEDIFSKAIQELSVKKEKKDAIMEVYTMPVEQKQKLAAASAFVEVVVGGANIVSDFVKGNYSSAVFKAMSSGGRLKESVTYASKGEDQTKKVDGQKEGIEHGAGKQKNVIIEVANKTFETIYGEKEQTLSTEEQQGLMQLAASGGFVFGARNVAKNLQEGRVLGAASAMWDTVAKSGKAFVKSMEFRSEEEKGEKERGIPHKIFGAVASATSTVSCFARKGVQMATGVDVMHLTKSQKKKLSLAAAGAQTVASLAQVAQNISEGDYLKAALAAWTGVHATKSFVDIYAEATLKSKK